MNGYFDWAYAGQIAVYMVIALLLGWLVVHFVAKAVLEMERIVASDEADDVAVEEPYDDYEESEYVG